MNQLLSKNVQTRYTVLLKAIARYIFDRIAQLKEKHVRCNQAAFANKSLRKAIMTSSRLLNKFRQERTRSSNIAFKKQQIIFVNNIDVKRVTVNKQFWKTVKPCLTDEA